MKKGKYIIFLFTFMAISVNSYAYVEHIYEGTILPVEINDSSSGYTVSVNSDGQASTESELVDADGNKAKITDEGFLWTGDFFQEVAERKFPGHKTEHIFSKNIDVDIGEEDLWTGNASSMTRLSTAETINFVSADVDDDGTVVSSGTATGGSTTTLIDTGATFQTDGVAVGDMLINDTQVCHGIVDSIDSEIQVTVKLEMNRGSQGGGPYTNTSGDTYRIVTPTSTGAATVIVLGLDGDGNEIVEYIVMNGTTNVLTTNSFWRPRRAIVITAGTSQVNEGAITGITSSTTVMQYNIRALDGNKTEQSQYTVPLGKTAYLLTWDGGIEGKSAASGEFNLLVAPYGEVYELYTEASTNVEGTSYFVKSYKSNQAIPELSDIKVQIDTEDSNLIVTSNYSLLIVDNDQ